MLEVGHSQLSAWESFYVIVGSSGAALVGLQFVVLTLVAERRPKTSTGTIRAFGTPTVVHFAGATLIAAVMSAPWPTLKSTSLAIAICGLIGLGYAAVVIFHARRQKEYEPVGEDWLWYVILPCVIYATLTIAALLIHSSSQIALFLIGASALGLLLLGIRNAWDTVTYIVVGGDASATTSEETQPTTSEETHSTP
jgi:hypothetical protein